MGGVVEALRDGEMSEDEVVLTAIIVNVCLIQIINHSQGKQGCTGGGIKRRKRQTGEKAPQYQHPATRSTTTQHSPTRAIYNPVLGPLSPST